MSHAVYPSPDGGAYVPLRVSTVSKIVACLADTTIPADLVNSLLGEASTLWLASAPAPLLASDLALCYPSLQPREVRAVVCPVDDGGHRLTVVAHDRRGLLADTAAVLATEGLSIASASAATWASHDIALHAVVIAPGQDPPLWPDLGARLSALTADTAPTIRFEPHGQAVVTSSAEASHHRLITVTAPDQIGLLWATCGWLADRGVNIEWARVGGHDGIAEDLFMVVGDANVDELAAHLSAARAN
jgi:predicted amino acid-binding ACT domain protein